MIVDTKGISASTLRKHQQRDEEREGEEHVGDPHQDVVEPPAAVPGERADDRADACRR